MEKSVRTLEMPALDRRALAKPATSPGDGRFFELTVDAAAMPIAASAAPPPPTKAIVEEPMPAAPSSERASHGPVAPVPVMMVGAEVNEPAVVVAHDLVEPWVAKRNARTGENAPVQAQTADPFPALPVESYLAPTSREGADDETQLSLHGLQTKRRWKTRIALAILAVAATVAFAHRATLRAPSDLADAKLMVRAATAHVANSVARDISLTRSRVSPSAIVPDVVGAPPAEKTSVDRP